MGARVRQTRVELGKTQIVRVRPCVLKYLLRLSKVQERERRRWRRESKEVKKKGRRVANDDGVGPLAPNALHQMHQLKARTVPVLS